MGKKSGQSFMSESPQKRKPLLLALCSFIALVSMLFAVIAVQADDGDILSGNYWYRVLDESKKTAAFAGYNQPVETLEIPKTIDGYTIVEIGERAVYFNPELKKVIVPDTVTAIGKKLLQKTKLWQKLLYLTVWLKSANRFLKEMSNSKKSLCQETSKR